MENCVYICPKCGDTYVCPEDGEWYCATCGEVLIPSGYTEEEWNALSQDWRQAIISKATGKFTGSDASYPNSSSFTKNNGWNNLLRSIMGIYLTLLCVGIFIIGFNIGRSTGSTALGLVIIVLGILLAFISVAAVMVFLDMSSDIRAIRQILERKER